MNTMRNSATTVGVCRIARTLLCSCLIAVVVTVAKSADLDDPKIRRLESPPAASGLSDKTVMADRVAALDTEIGQMLAAVTRAGVSSPGQMAGILQELRVESAAHLGRLDFEEIHDRNDDDDAGRRSGVGRSEQTAPACHRFETGFI
jgi:hypothetical protein